MVYRREGQVQQEAPVILRYGPIPARWGYLGIAAACLAVGLVSLSAGLARDRLRCTRASDPEGTCTVDSELPLYSRRRASFAAEDVREVRWTPYEGNKGSDMGKTVLILSSGRGVDVADGDRAGARALYLEINQFFDEHSQRSLDVIEPRVPLMVGVGVFLLLGFVAAMVALLRSTTSIRLVIDRERQVLKIQRRHFGFPGRSETHDLHDLVTIDVEQGAIPLWYHNKNAPGAPGGRITLHFDDDSEVGVTDELLLGHEVHHSTAARLRELLFLSAAESEQETDDSPSNLDEDAALPSSPPKSEPSKFPIKPRYLLVIVLILFVPSLGIFMTESLDPNRGTLEVRCTHRCKFGATECLPGGHWQGSYAAGTYTFEVWNPREPDNWETRTAQVTAGQRTVFECQPTRE